MAHRLQPLLEPTSIALIGASDHPGRIGGMPLDLLRHFEYAGQVFPVNPKYQEVFGYPCYPDIESVPQVPDLVVLAIGAADVLPMLRRCHARGIPAAILYAAGFAEMGGEGERLQDALQAFVSESGMAVAGPNCMGFANLNRQAYTAFASVFRKVAPQQEAGRISLVTQSGNVCSVLFGLLRQMDLPVSHFINTGNEACIEFSEYLQYLAEDDSTDCVVGYIEQLRDGEQFIDAALSLARADKPLILYKAGETEKGSEAVRSHTSALAGDQAVYQAAFRQLAVLHADDFVQMADLAWLSGFRHRQAGTRVGIVTLSGALGAILADKFIGAGLEVPTFPPALQALLRDGIPDYGMVSNPVDVTGNIVNDPGFVTHVFSALAQSNAIDVVVIYASGALLDRMAEPLMAVARQYPRLLVAIDTGQGTCHEALAASGIPVFTDLGRAVRALTPFCRWRAERWQALHWGELRKQTAERAATVPVNGGLNEFQTKRLLQDYGLQSVPEQMAVDEEQAVAAATALGYPVVLKILSADIAHKTEVGGVRLNLASESAVREAFRQIMASARLHAPQARLDGVLVQAMSSGVAELIVGVSRDPVFGPVLTTGLGGTLTELYRDAAHRLLPVDADMATTMLQGLKAFPLLTGFRGRPMADLAAATDAVAALSRAAGALSGQVAELEVNPLLVRPEGKGALALDALLLPDIAADGAQVAEA